eukprot:CAMPEP_0181277370 /NCGR_PEP_ID=MMETSP1097-20121128/11060_1 /TAXON_ID=35684 /ORGANISM="Pseudopedinella elastica, Strain CCMP716" /LENGTH=34 /DNA_ID= /DNA_START= /DNA_END= /DNA_ORIENTATION=
MTCALGAEGRGGHFFQCARIRVMTSMTARQAASS